MPQSASRRNRRKYRRRRLLESLEPRQLLASLAGEVWVDLDSNGIRDASDTVAASVRVYLDANDNGQLDTGEQFTSTNPFGQYAFNQVAAGTHVVRLDLNPNQTQIAPGRYLGTVAESGGGTQLFELGENGEVNTIGQPQSATIDGLVRTNSGVLIGIDDQADTLFTLDEATGQETLLMSHSVDIVAGLAYDPTGDTVYTLARIGGFSNVIEVYEVDPADGTLTGIGTGTTNLNGVSDLTFDTINQTIVAFDDSTDEFAVFDTSGNLVSRTGAQSTIDGSSLAFNGQEFLMFDEADTNNTSLLAVDPTNGTSQFSFIASQSLPNVESLEYLSSGAVAQRVTVQDTDSIVLPDFGIEDLALGATGEPTLGGLYINELLVSPLFGDNATDQYVEIRGDADAMIPANTYLVVVDDDNSDAGEIHGIFDLSNQQLGSDGFLVLLQEDSPFTPHPDATVLQSTAPGFGGLPGNIYSDSFALTDNIDFNVGANSFMLIESAIPPQLGDDIDADNDGTIDAAGIPQSWQVLDSISLHPFSGLSRQAYGNIVMLEEGVSVPTTLNTPPGAEVVVQSGFGYAGRVGDSVGSTSADWVSGTIEEIVSSASGNTIGNGVTIGAQAGNDTLSRAQDVSDEVYSLQFNASVFESTTRPYLSIRQQSSPGNVFEYYRFEVRQPLATVTIDTDNTNFDTEIHLFDAFGTPIASDDDGFEANDTQSLNSFLTVNLGIGAYVIGVGRFSSNATAGGIIGDTIPAGGFYDLHISVDQTQVQNTSQFAFTSGPSGWPSQPAFMDRSLDHVGDSNFVGGARGTVFMDPPATDPTGAPQPAPGVTVFADTNNNNFRDNLDFSVDANSRPTGRSLTNAFPGVTLSTADTNNEILDFNIEGAQQFNGQVAVNNQIFSYEGTTSFSDTRKLRIDFYRPANSVAIDAIGENNFLSSTYGALEAYDSDDNMIGRVLSQPLSNGVTENIGLSFATDSIAYVIAYADPTPNSSIFTSRDGRFDNFTYRQFEASDISDSEGFFELSYLFPDQYRVVYQNNSVNEPLFGADPVPISVSNYENHVLGPNIAPVVSDVELSIPENLGAGSFLTVVPAFDPGGQIVYSIETVETYGIQINPSTGALTIGPNAILDFESTPEILLDVQVIDDLGAFANATVTINLTDVNEAPIATPISLAIPEDTLEGTSIGQVSAMDPDTEQNQSLTYTLIGGTGASAFDIDPNTGSITLSNAALINFETQTSLTLLVEVVDDGAPTPLSTTITQLISILDANDAPNIVTTSLSVAENSTGSIGTIITTDPDVDETLHYVVNGGTGAAFFDIIPGGHVVLLDGRSLDFESNTTFSLDVTVFDGGTPPLSDSQQLLINVTDVDEPSVLAATTGSVPENSPAGTLVATLSLVDPEGQTPDNSVSLVGIDDAVLFQFDPQTLQLTVAPGTELDFETRRAHVVTFEISDNTSVTPTTRETFTINVTDANDPPSLVSQRLAVSELTNPGDVVGTLRISDPDIGQIVSAEITGGTGQTLFDLDPLTHELSLSAGAVLDAEALATDHFTLDIRLTDAGGEVVDTPIIVLVNDVNEEPVFEPGIALPGAVSGTPFVFTIADEDITDPENRNLMLAIFDENGVLPSWLTFDQETRTLSGMPNPTLVGSTTLTIHAFEAGPPNLFNSTQVTLDVTAGDTPYNNAGNIYDVDVNGVVAPRDALLILNYITQFGVGPITQQLDKFIGFVDVSGDGEASALDAVRVINALTIQQNQNESLDFLDDREEAIDAVLADFESMLF